MPKFEFSINKAGVMLAFAITGLSIGACSTTTAVSSRMQLSSVAIPPSGLVAFCSDIRSKCKPVTKLVEEAASVSTGGHGDNTQLRYEGFTMPVSQPAQVMPFIQQASFIVGDPTPANEIIPALEKLPTSQDNAELSMPAVSTNMPNKPQSVARKMVARVEVPATILADVEKINQMVNNRITWQSDLESYGLEEQWTMPLAFDLSRFGDCEDYALEKRRLLLEMGIPAGALALATATSKATGRHALLVIRTTEGDYALDNTTPWVLPWSDTGYKWLTIQEGESMLQWRAVASLETHETKS